MLDLAIATALSLLAVLSILGVTHGGEPQGGALAAAGVLAMTLPVGWRRQAPTAAAVSIAAGALLNGMLFGHLVRCGTALPAVFLVVYAVGARRVRARAAAGLGLCAVNVMAQAWWDPQLGPETAAYLLPILAGFFVLGILVRSRTVAARALQRQAAVLRARRDETAELTIAADQTKLADDLDRGLRDHLDAIIATAESGRAQLSRDPAAARAMLPSIERDARDALRRMRELVGALADPLPSQAQPTLASLPALLATAAAADTQLSVEGDPRPLPSGLSLSGYRIVEYLLSVIEDAPSTRAEIRVRYSPESLELTVAGPLANATNIEGVLAAARERAALYQGTVDASSYRGTCHARAVIPLVSRYA